MAYQIATTRDRLRSASGAALIVALVAFGLARGLGVDVSRQVVEDLKVVALLPDAPPPKPDPVPAHKQAEKRKEGAASPPNLKSKATEVVAPPPPIILRQPDPIAVAPIAGLGSDRSAGAALVAGPGTGSGGQGSGLGSGDSGDGDGGGGGTEAQLINKHLPYNKLPKKVKDSFEQPVTNHERTRVDVTVTYRGVIGINGRLTDCRIIRSSGNQPLDGATCALALGYVRFRPATNAAGRKVTDSAIFEQKWTYAPGDRDTDDPDSD